MGDIGKRIKELREAHHLSQAEFAKLCGSNQATVAKTETGKTAPSLKLLMGIAEYFDISMDYLCCRTDQPEIVRVCAPAEIHQRGHEGVYRNVL